MTQSIERYARHQKLRPHIDAPCDPATRLICVIPCMDEPDILANVAQIQSSLPPASEILVVVNHAADAPVAVRRRNLRTIEELRRQGLAHVIPALDLPPGRAGVGMARKLGMDEAMLRLARAGRPDGLIASLDADCRVEADYGRALLRWADAHPGQHAMLCDFAHPLEAAESVAARRAIVDYELFLRVIALGWRLARLPYAFVAIGSCMVVRASAYARHSGMNRRTAGEDFHFMHKLAREREIVTLGHVRVYPSPRPSTRTPFGTGQAVRAWCDGDTRHRQLVDARVFLHLRRMVESLPALFAGDMDEWLASLDAELAGFLHRQNLARALRHMRANAASEGSFRRHFFTWFDGLRAWRYLHARRASEPCPLHACARDCLRLHGMAGVDGDAETLLRIYRKLPAEGTGSMEQEG